MLNAEETTGNTVAQANDSFTDNVHSYRITEVEQSDDQGPVQKDVDPHYILSK